MEHITLWLTIMFVWDLINHLLNRSWTPFAGDCGWETEEVVGRSNSLLTFFPLSPHLRRLFGHYFPYSPPLLKF